MDETTALLEHAAHWIDVIGDGLEVEIIEALLKYQEYDELRVVLKNLDDDNMKYLLRDAMGA